ncbi:uncharacterized protein LY89DRAFT_510910 [Mollisia scopiformis]|uniref:Uncharacterized protein n=1 Tax=Mollisia scopiformis TaxID=149040 RepID=A0A194XFS8_MOLSC|nr:uncharacterized protein LY89DRAFT_510910 [Mollisia scopiformis]KUJ19023.1 hypothetical protein LY89DRAFT_510910 [Mollisia scopiformis]
MTGLESWATATSAYSSGDSFSYTAAANSDMSIDISLVNGPETFDDATCAGAPTVSGTDGGFLGCVAQAVAWMTYAVYADGGPVDTTPVRRSSFSSDPQFQYHAEWQPAGNCTTSHCMLMNGSPEGVWVPAGNGTYNGTFHDFHFTRTTNNIVGHRVWPGGFQSASAATDMSMVKPRSGTLAGRQYRWRGQLVGWGASSRVDWYHRSDPAAYMNWYDYDRKGALDVSNTIAAAVEDTVAQTHYPELCVGLAYEGSVVDTGLWNIVANGTTATNDISLAQAETDLTGCSGSSAVIVCYANATAIDTSLATADDESSTAPTITKRMLQFFNLFGRTATSGSEETYEVTDVVYNTGTLQFVAPTYPNGGNGYYLNQENGHDSAYALLNPGNCLDGTLTDDADTTSANQVTVVTEHVLERVTGRNFLEYVQRPVMDLADGNGDRTSTLTAVPFTTLANWADLPYAQWVNNNLPTGFPTANLPTVGSAFTDFADAFGSTANPDVLTNLEESLNGYKARVYSTTIDPSADDTFDPLTETPTIANTQSALTLLRLGFGVFNYINDDYVSSLASDSYSDMLTTWQTFDELYTLANPSTPSNMAGLWAEFMDRLATRMVNVHRTYMNDRLDQLAAPWIDIQAAPASTSQQQIDATNALNLISQMRAQITTIVHYDTSGFSGAGSKA